MRGLKSRNFWIMEQQAGPGGWEVVGAPPHPGELRLWAYQALAHGADGILFFRWRTARYGTEQYWHGLLEHDGRPGRRYQEIKGMGCEVRRIGDLVSGSTVRAQVAFLLSYESRFAFQIQPNNPQFSYTDHFHTLYRAFFERGVAVDIVAPTADLSVYRLVVAPALHILSAATAKRLEDFVHAGGVLLVTPRSGVKDEFNAAVDLPLPGLLAEVCGVIVEEYASLPSDMAFHLEFDDELDMPGVESKGIFVAHTWCDVLELRGAQALARYVSGEYDRYEYDGRPAISVNQYGNGVAVYQGTLGDETLLRAVTEWLLKHARLDSALPIPAGVEVAERWQGEKRLLFILNHSDLAQEIILDHDYTDILNGAPLAKGNMMLPARELMILVRRE
jgi:beta-galactosidase